MSKVFRSCLALVLTLLAPGRVAAAAPATGIVHEPLSCAPLPMQNTRIAAKVTLDGPVASARTYFRYLDDKDAPFSYIELRHADGDQFWGVLPKAEESTSSVEYRLLATDGKGREYSTELVKVPVTKDCSVALTDAEQRYASNLVIGHTDGKQQQDARPDGFLCDGIVSKITPDGVLLPAESCPKVPLLAIGAGAAGALGGIYAVTGRGEKPVSPSRPAPPSTPR
jgi:hypothetical protein